MSARSNLKNGPPALVRACVHHVAWFSSRILIWNYYLSVLNTLNILVQVIQVLNTDVLTIFCHPCPFHQPPNGWSDDLLPKAMVLARSGLWVWSAGGCGWASRRRKVILACLIGIHQALVLKLCELVQFQAAMNGVNAAAFCGINFSTGGIYAKHWAMVVSLDLLIWRLKAMGAPKARWNVCTKHCWWYELVYASLWSFQMRRVWCFAFFFYIGLRGSST